MFKFNATTSSDTMYHNKPWLQSVKASAMSYILFVHRYASQCLRITKLVITDISAQYDHLLACILRYFFFPTEVYLMINFNSIVVISYGDVSL